MQQPLPSGALARHTKHLVGLQGLSRSTHYFQAGVALVMYRETRSVRLQLFELPADFYPSYEAVAKDLQFLGILKRLCNVEGIELLSATTLSVTVWSLSQVANNLALSAVETAVRNYRPNTIYSMLLCHRREIKHLTDGTGRFKEPLGVVIALGVPLEPYELQPVFISSHDGALLSSTYAHIQNGQQQISRQFPLTVQNSFSTFGWPDDFQMPSLPSQLVLQQLEVHFNLSPCDRVGADFFSEWGRAVYGSPIEGVRVRQDLVRTIWTSPELQARVAATAMRQGISPEDYFRCVTTVVINSNYLVSTESRR